MLELDERLSSITSTNVDTFRIPSAITLADVVFSTDAGSQMKAPVQPHYVSCADL